MKGITTSHLAQMLSQRLIARASEKIASTGTQLSLDQTDHDARNSRTMPRLLTKLR